jgi:hypothetical protein
MFFFYFHQGGSIGRDPLDDSGAFGPGGQGGPGNNSDYRIYSRISREILEKISVRFYSFDLYTGHRKSVYYTGWNHDYRLLYHVSRKDVN